MWGGTKKTLPGQCNALGVDAVVLQWPLLKDGHKYAYFTHDGKEGGLDVGEVLARLQLQAEVPFLVITYDGGSHYAAGLYRKGTLTGKPPTRGTWLIPKQLHRAVALDKRAAVLKALKEGVPETIALLLEAGGEPLCPDVSNMHRDTDVSFVMETSEPNYHKGTKGAVAGWPVGGTMLTPLPTPWQAGERTLVPEQEPHQVLRDELAKMVWPLRTRLGHGLNSCMQISLLMQAHATCVQGLSHVPENILNEAIALKRDVGMDIDAPTFPCDVARLLVSMGIGLVMVEPETWGVWKVQPPRVARFAVLVHFPGHVEPVLVKGRKRGKLLLLPEVIEFINYFGFSPVAPTLSEPLGALEDRLHQLPLLNTPACRPAMAPAEPGAPQGAVNTRPALDVNQLGSVTTQLYGQGSMEAAHREAPFLTEGPMEAAHQAMPLLSEEVQRNLDTLRESRRPTAAVQDPCETPMGAAARPREAHVNQTAAITTANTCSAAPAATPALAMTALGDTTASWCRDSLQATIDKVRATGRIVLEGAERAAEETSRTLFTAPCTQAMPCATADGCTSSAVGGLFGGPSQSAFGNDSATPPGAVGRGPIHGGGAPLMPPLTGVRTPRQVSFPMPPSTIPGTASGTPDGAMGRLALCANAPDANTPDASTCAGKQDLHTAGLSAAGQAPPGYAELFTLVREMRAQNDATARESVVHMSAHLDEMHRQLLAHVSDNRAADRERADALQAAYSQVVAAQLESLETGLMRTISSLPSGKSEATPAAGERRQPPGKHHCRESIIDLRDCPGARQCDDTAAKPGRAPRGRRDQRGANG